MDADADLDSVIRDRTFAFIGGLHRSGTSLLHDLLRTHPAVSGFHNTGVPEDEGQHLQTVFPPAKTFGGPGRFAFDPRAHMGAPDDEDPRVLARRLMADWGPHHDLSRPVLLEKSPPNLIRARWFQAVFPDARFILVVRHPVAVTLATRKWSDRSLAELLLHWDVAHQLAQADLAQLRRATVVRYEDLMADPAGTVARLLAFLGLDPAAGAPGGQDIADRNAAYFERWRAEGTPPVPPPVTAMMTRPEGPMARHGYRLNAPWTHTIPLPDQRRGLGMSVRALFTGRPR